MAARLGGVPSRLEVLIPHLNRAESLARTLDSLGRQTIDADVCVIDNASTDGTLPMLEERYPQVRVLKLDRNHGFGAAVNRGSETSTADLMVLLNNDAVADSRFLESLVAARDQADADAVAGCMRAPGGSVESLGVAIDRSLSVYDAGHGLPAPPESVEPEPMGASGGAALFRRAAFERIGGFDEAIFAYLEDADLAIRMRLAGMVIAFAPAAVVWHEHSATLGSGSAAKNELMGYSRSYLLWKYGRGLSARRRLQAHLTDAVIYAGKAVIDRNLGAVKGHARAWREHRGVPRPAPGPDFAALPFLPLGPLEALARRLDRRR